MAYFECMIGGSGDGSTLTVTCYSGFAGSTISITNGVDTYSDVCPSSSPYEVVFSGLANGTWTISGIYDGTTYTKTVEVNLETGFYPTPIGATVTPVNVIQTWLHCAEIWDKTYTTINQVLADTSTLLALISSNNAADYMARSTNWASSVCANQTAMVYIGNNNYCANKLLANSTWLNAICDSTYLESVLNVKVPTMTSNTTPSGEVVYSSQNATYPAYQAFNNNTSNAWGPSDATVPQWIGYKFTSNMVVHKIIIRPDANYNGSSVKDFKLQGSNDGTTYTDIQSNSCPNETTATDHSFAILNSIGYKYLRIYITSKNGSWPGGTSVSKLQFYGRA